MRVVLDTNILVSACWKPEGLEARVVTLAMEGQIAACVSMEILAEYRDVLGRPKLASVNGRAVGILAALERVAVCVQSGPRVSESVDDDDNRFLECAAAARAEYVITGNLRHFPALWEAPHGTIRAVNARAFLSAALPDTGIDTIPLQ